MKLVVLTATDGKPVHVNPEQVRFVTKDRDGQTEIVFDVSLSVLVKEPLEAACRAIAGN
jgi:hypothetical protein